jgi:hypothetical protein
MRGRPGASQEIIVRDSEFRKTGPEKELWRAEYLPVKRDVRHPFDFYWEFFCTALAYVDSRRYMHAMFCFLQKTS